jgi:hypothetical protein
MLTSGQRSSDRWSSYTPNTDNGQWLPVRSSAVTRSSRDVCNCTFSTARSRLLLLAKNLTTSPGSFDCLLRLVVLGSKQNVPVAGSFKPNSLTRSTFPSLDLLHRARALCPAGWPGAKIPQLQTTMALVRGGQRKYWEVGNSLRKFLSSAIFCPL